MTPWGFSRLSFRRILKPLSRFASLAVLPGWPGVAYANTVAPFHHHASCMNRPFLHARSPQYHRHHRPMVQRGGRVCFGTRASKLLGASRALMYASSQFSRMSGAPTVFYDWLALQWKWRVVHRLNLFLDFCQAFCTAVGQPSPRFRT